MQTHCFTYGTLMCADIMSAVSGRPLSGEPARLDGYARHAVRDEDYPGIQPAPGAQVEGVLYRDIDAAALARLDAFEGDMYARETVRITLADGTSLVADTYVIRPQHRTLLLAEDWNFAAFLTHGKARFTRRYMGFSRI